MKLSYGEETKKALNNFPFSSHKTRMEFILAMVQIKKAAAIANYTAGNLDKNFKDAIVKICDEILNGKHGEHFSISYLQGGAGTASHMNVNEVIANKATLLLKKQIHPNNHVNSSQSTNDVNPSALKIVSFSLLENLETTLASLVKSFENKAKEFKNVDKLARTHLQDAIPTTLRAEFLAYANNLERHKIQIKNAKNICRVLNLGGTAIGNSINASPTYIKEVYKELNKITGEKFVEAKNMMAKTSSQVDFLIISQTLTALCVDLSKIANDFRFMASGPHGGIGEILLPELQKGSSIMPGKINPVMPETVNQLYYLVSGNNLSIEKAVEASQMELGVMLPVIVEKLIDSIKLTTEVIEQFDKLCVRGLKADKEKCKYFLENSTAYATLFVPVLGYDLVSSIVRESISTKRTFRETVLEGKYLKESKFNKIIKQHNA